MNFRNNQYAASFKINETDYSIPCEYIDPRDHCTVVYGIPLTGSTGYPIVLASVPKDVFVQLTELKMISYEKTNL